jgi:hypothetical protein
MFELPFSSSMIHAIIFILFFRIKCRCGLTFIFVKIIFESVVIIIFYSIFYFKIY